MTYGSMQERFLDRGWRARAAPSMVQRNDALMTISSHPEQELLVLLDEALGTYAWHGRHHVAHITSLRQRSAW